jgi:hypothetical protein
MYVRLYDGFSPQPEPYMRVRNTCKSHVYMYSHVHVCISGMADTAALKKTI